MSEDGKSSVIYPEERMEAIDHTRAVRHLERLVTLFAAAKRDGLPERCLTAIADAVVGVAAGFSLVSFAIVRDVSA